MATKKRKQTETGGEEPAATRARTEAILTTGYTAAGQAHAFSHRFHSLPTHVQRLRLGNAKPAIRFVPFARVGKPDAVMGLFRFLLRGVDEEPSDVLKYVRMLPYSEIHC